MGEAREAFGTSSGGVRLWTIAEGDGPLTILLSNGGAGCCDYLAPLAALLMGETQNRRIVRWEQRGTGRSGGNPDGPFTIAECIADMEAVRAAYGCAEWVVSGHSWGADLSLMYCLAHPERCVGLVGVAGGRLNNDREWHAAYDRGMREGRESPPDFAYPPNVVASRTRTLTPTTSGMSSGPAYSERSPNSRRPRCFCTARMIFGPPDLSSR